jgi:hypothetical protein
LLIAVANANDGIDWYLVPQRRFLHTTIYDFCGEYYMVDLEFLDDITVAAGHSQSRLIFATVGMLTQPQTYDFPGDPDCRKHMFFHQCVGLIMITSASYSSRGTLIFRQLMAI